MGSSPSVKKHRLTDWIIPLLGVMLVVGFFIAHQAWSTGFFNANFDLAEAVLFYGVFFFVALQVIAPIYLVNRRAITTVYSTAAIFCIVATAWLIIRYPFNFSHLTDVMPARTQFSRNRVTSDLGQLLVVLLLVGADALIIFDMANYRSLLHGAHARVRS